MDPRTGMDDVEKRIFLNLPGFELRPLGRPAHGQSLYRLHYPSFNNNNNNNNKPIDFSFTYTALKLF
jgi:hypothetical protein